jgi:hypothetical protein
MQDLATRPSTVSADLQEKVLLGGDLARLTPAERLSYYNAVCQSVGLNPLTRPFEYLALNGKLVLYARKDCTDQLRDLHGISITIVGREVVDGCYCVTAQGKNMTERTDESLGAVPLPTSPTDKANAMMKAETKAKRRVTLSICGLGMLDETEIETIAGAHPIPSPKPAPAEARQDTAGGYDSPKDAPAQAERTGDPPPAPASVFDESSAIADHETVLDECKTDDELKQAWEDCTKDSRLTSVTRAPLYNRMVKLQKGMKAKK